MFEKYKNSTLNWIVIGLILFIMGVASCNNPLEVGLGEKVDIKAPIINVASHERDSYVSGEINLVGEWEDDGIITLISVTQMITENGEPVEEQAYEATFNRDDGTWNVLIDTSAFEDGMKQLDIYIEDNTGKSGSSNITLFFDNNDPVVLVNEPKGFPYSVDFNQDIRIRGESGDLNGIVSTTIEVFRGTEATAFITEDLGSSVGWSYNFTSSDYTSTTGDYQFLITAEDRAGNTNSHFYHFTTISDAVTGTVGSFSVEDIILLESVTSDAASDSVFGLGSEALMATAHDNKLGLPVDQDGDIPTFVFNTPELPSGGLLYSFDTSTPSASGQIVDDDAIRVDTMQIKIDSDPWVNIDSVPDNDMAVANWSHSLVGLAQGNHTLQLRAKDIYMSDSDAYITSDEVDFQIDSTGPVLTIASPAIGSYHNSAITVSGVASDNLGVRKIQLKIDDGAYQDVVTYTDTDVDNAPVNGGTGLKDFNYSFDITTLFDGSYEGAHMLRIQTFDTGGKATVESIQVNVDTISPTLRYLAPADGNTVNGDILIYGTSSDASPFNSLVLTATDGATTETYTLGHATPALGFDNDPEGNPSTEYFWYKTISSTNFADLQNLTLTMSAEDEANNSRNEVITVAMDQSTDKPEMFFDNLDTSALVVANDNGFAAMPTFIGRVQDDDGVDTASITVQFSDTYDSGSSSWINWAAARPVTDVDGSGRSVQWSYTPDGTDVPGQGKYAVRFQVADIYGTTSDISSDIPFLLDTGAPTISIANVDGQNSGYQGAFVNDTLVITGTATDAFGVASVEYILVHGGTAANPPAETTYLTPAPNFADPTNVTWTFTHDLTTGPVPDGDYSLQFIATDDTGKTSVKDVALIVDQLPPSISFIDLYDNTQKTNGLNGAIHFKGTASDGNLIDRVEYVIVPSTRAYGDVDPADWTTLPGKYTWDFWIDSTGNDSEGNPFVVNTGAPLFTPVFYTVYVRAFDGAGSVDYANYSDLDVAFKVDQSADTPVLSLSNRTHNGTSGLYVVESGILRGTVYDDDAVDVDSITLTINGVAVNNTNGLATEGAGNDISFSYNLAESTIAFPAGVPEGEVTLVVAASDDQTVKEGTSGFTLLPANQSLSGISTDVNGANFYYDTGAPSLGATIQYSTVSGDVSGATLEVDSLTDEIITLNGTASDGNTISSIIVDYSFNDGADWYGNISATPNTANFATWSASVNFNTHIQNGEMLIRHRLTDQFGKSSVEINRIQVDITAPSVEMKTPALGNRSDLNGEINIDGTASEGQSNIITVEYSLRNNGLAPVWVDITANGKTNWKFPILDARNPALFAHRVDNTTGYASGLAYEGVVGSANDGDFIYLTNGTYQVYEAGTGWVTLHDGTNWVADQNYNIEIPVKIRVTDAASNTNWGDENNAVVDYTVNPAANGLYNLSVNHYADKPSIQLSNVNLESSSSNAGNNLLESLPKLIGAVSDDDSIATVEISLNNGVDWDPVTVSGGSWTYNLYNEVDKELIEVADGDAFTIYEGENSFILRVRDTNYSTAADWYSESQTIRSWFAIDLSSPEIAITALDTDGDMATTVATTGDDLEQFTTGLMGKNISRDYYIMGTASDPNNVALEVNVDNAGWVSLASDANFNIVTDDGNGNVTWSYFVDTTPNTALDTHSYAFRATDDFGKPSETSVSLNIDTKAPQLAFSDYINGDTVNGVNLIINGTTNDENLLESVQFEYERPGIVGFSTAADVTGSYNWNCTIPLTDASLIVPVTNPDGYCADGAGLSVRITAVDKAGNETVETLTLNIDQSQDMPSIALSNASLYSAPGTATVNLSANQTLIAGVLIDSNGVDASSLAVTVGGVLQSPVILEDNGHSVTWYADLSALGNGAHLINSVTATDDGASAVEQSYYGVPGDSIAVLPESSEIIGSVIDDDMIDVSTLTVTVDGGTPTQFGSSDAPRIDWTYSMGDVDNGLHVLEFAAQDTGGIATDWSRYGGTNPVILILNDTDMPGLLVNSPDQAAYINRSQGSEGYAWDDSRLTSFVITAEKTDGSTLVINNNLSGGELVYGNHDHDSNAGTADVTGYHWDFLFSTENIPDEYTGESIEISYVAKDIAGRSNSVIRSITIDKDAPVVNYIFPDTTGKNVNGEVTLRGDVVDANIEEVFLMVGNNEITNYGSSPSTYSMGKVYSWSRTIADIGSFANSGDATIHFDVSVPNLASLPPTGDPTDIYFIADIVEYRRYNTDTPGWEALVPNLWDLPLRVIAIDKAGNQTVDNTMTLLVDPDRDAPVAEIFYPAMNDNIGGSIRVSGTANDDDAIQRVEMRIDIDNDGAFDKQIDFWDGSLATPTGNPDGDYTDPFEDESQWYEITGQDSWYQIINKFGEFYSGNTFNVQSGGTITTDGNVTLQVRSVDIYNLVGGSDSVSFTLDNTVPRIENESHPTGTFASGSFKITADLSDDALGGIEEVWISYNGGANFTQIYNNEGVTNADVIYNSAIDMTLDLDLDTTNASNPEYVHDSVSGYDSGQLRMAVKVIDSSGYTTVKDMVLNIDNELPTVSLDTNPGKTQVDDLSGTEVFIGGDSTDNGSVAGTKEVYVYLQRGTNLIDLTNGNLIALAGLNPATQYDSIISSGTYDNALIHINDMDEYGDKTSPGADVDAYSEYLTNLVPTTQWYALFDSTVISSGVAGDGLVNIHFVGYDNAGNVSKGQENDALIANNKPNITNVEIGFNADRSTGPTRVEAGEIFTYVDGTRPVVYDYMHLDITATDNTAVASYEVLNEASAVVQSTASGEFDVSSYSGDYTFTIKVTDDTGVYSLKEIDVTVSNNDTTVPTVLIYDLDDLTYTDEDGVSQDNVNSNGEVIATLDGPGDGTGNIQGHVELTTYSNHDNIDDPGTTTTTEGPDADVSGIITLRGHVGEDRAIRSINITIGGVDKGTSTFSGGSWSAVTGLTINDTLSGTGHEVSWSYDWDTSTVAGVAGNNVNVVVTAENFGDGVTPLSANDSLTADVVPYITGVLRDPDSYSTLRSSLGRYAIRRSEANVQINGYNLRTGGTGDSVGIHNNLTDAAGAMNSIFSTVGSSSTGLTATIPSDAPSGWLRVFVGGIEAVNNGNDNTQSYNKELDVANSRSTFWVDDRYIHAFAAGTGTADYFDDDDGDPQYPAMDMASDGTLYSSWVTYGTSDVSYSRLANNSVVDVWHGYDPPEFTDIVVTGTGEINVLYLANYNGGNGWDSSSATAGGLYLYDDDAPSIGCQRNPSNPTYRFELMYHDETLLQFRNIRVARGTNGRIHVAYYDNDSGSIKFSSINDGYSYGRYNVNGYNETTDEISWVNIDGGDDTHDTQIVPDTQFSIASTDNRRATAVGEYVAITVDEQNYPVMVYYDAEHTTMRLARTNQENPNLQSEWNVQEVLASTDENFNFTGDFVTAVVDGAGYLHIAAYKSSQGKIVYVKSTNDPDNGAAYTFGPSVVIDTQAGSRADLHIEQIGTGASAVYTPYVSYLDSTGINGFNGLKIAYLDSEADMDFDGNPDEVDLDGDEIADQTGRWETINVPLIQNIKDVRISMVTSGNINTGWTAAMGYKSGSHYYVSYLYPE